MATFVDRVVLHVRAGNGGHGCASIRREKFKPLAGPDGANGGHGGDVIFQVDSNVTTLLSYHHSPHRNAENGGPGAGDLRQGKNGNDLVLQVPSGTVIKDKSGRVLADIVGDGTTFVAAKGGTGGLGNAALASAKRKAPGFALLGEEGEEIELVLELKSVADVALVGYPSAGKSSLIAAVSAARPKIADYPFTTLVPNLGVVQAGDYRYTIADVPGLIPGASQGKGLGLDFLRHIERCHVIVHVVDCATMESMRNPLADLEQIETELSQYAAKLENDEEGRIALMERPRLVVINKIDVPDGRDLAEFVLEEVKEKYNWPVFLVSAVSREGIKPLLFALGQAVQEQREKLAKFLNTESVQKVVLRPKAVDEVDFTVAQANTPTGKVFQVRGAKPERWVKQTDFTNDEAVGYIADRIERLGVEEELYKAGAVSGSTVVIGPIEGGVIFDWEPTMQSGAELLGPRGTDLRLEDRSRATRAEKRNRFYELMDAKQAARDELWTERERGHWVDPSIKEPQD